jgi:leucine dehydrogenase
MKDGMRELLKEWNGLGVVQGYDYETGTWMFIALHDATLGPMVGGCRMKSYPAPEDGARDAMRLAQGMTYKWAAIDFPFGGGKSVLAIPRPLEGGERRGLLRRFGRLLESLHGGYATGVDLGTTPEDMDVLAEASQYVMGHGVSGSGTEDPGPYTALGVYAGIRAGLEAVNGSADVAGKSVLIQGAGDVGAPLARMLGDSGAEVLISDLDEGLAQKLAAEIGGRTIPVDETYDTSCDVFAPCAVGAILNQTTIPQLNCRIVAGSANNQLDRSDDAELLHERGILYAPDYVVNAGGAIAFGMMHLGESSEEAMRDRVREIENTLGRIFSEASQSEESPVHGAKRVAEDALRRGREREQARASTHPNL